MPLFTELFLFAIAAGLLLQIWLLARHKHCVTGHRREVPEAFSGQVSLAEHQKAADYTASRIRLSLFELIYGTLLLLAWTLGGGLDLLARLWVIDNSLWNGIALIVSFFLISAILDLPFSLWRTFVLEQRYGFNRTTPGRFALDTLLQIMIGGLIGIPLIALFLWLMQNTGRGWWLIAWAAWMLFTLFISWLYPTLIAPIFNKFTPLEESELRSRIQQLLARCGFASKGIFVMDGSKRSGHGNAYFTGLGKNKRIVFYDTLIESLSTDEAEAVLAHELGHFKRHHVVKRLLVAAVSAFAAFALLGWLIDQHWFYEGLGVNQASHSVALLLFIMVIPVFSQFLTPLGSYYSRRHEFEADEYAVKMTSVRPMIRALVKLYRENASTLTPDPLYSAFHDSHPPAPVRIARLSSLSPC